MFPGSAGGMNWGSGAWDPGRSLLVTNLSQIGLYLKLVPRAQVPKADSFDPTRGAPMGPPGIIEGTFDHVTGCDRAEVDERPGQGGHR